MELCHEDGVFMSSFPYNFQNNVLCFLEVVENSFTTTQISLEIVPSVFVVVVLFIVFHNKPKPFFFSVKL